MKNIATVLSALALLAAASSAAAGTDVGVSIGISQPGVYGRIDIGTVSASPVLIYPQPVVIVRPAVMPKPVYMHVPPGHAKHWGKHCARYDACGRPVYFVQEGWYQQHYNGGPGNGPGKGKGHDKRG